MIPSNYVVTLVLFSSDITWLSIFSILYMSVAQTLQIWRSIVLDMHIKHNTFILYVLLRICFVSFLSCPCQRVRSMRHSSKIIYSHGRILLTYLGDLPLDSGWMTLQKLSFTFIIVRCWRCFSNCFFFLCPKEKSCYIDFSCFDFCLCC